MHRREANRHLYLLKEVHASRLTYDIQKRLTPHLQLV